MQPSSSTRATIVSAENQNGATIVKATFFFCHYYIVWESNNAGEARGQSWSESLKSRWIPVGSCGCTSGTKQIHFAALSSPRPCWRWLQLQPSCGSPNDYTIDKNTIKKTGTGAGIRVTRFLNRNSLTVRDNKKFPVQVLYCLVSRPYDVRTRSHFNEVPGSYPRTPHYKSHHRHFDEVSGRYPRTPH